MTDERQRDQAIERMLRHGGSAPSLAASSACIDGETLAAWSSGALDTRDASRVEEHLADCARCQSMLAAFVRTEPVAAAPAPWWRRTEVRWLVPLATAATVAAIWVVTPQPNEPAAPAAESRDSTATQTLESPSETKPVEPGTAAPKAVPPSPSRARPAAPTPPPPQVGAQVEARLESGNRVASEPAAPPPPAAPAARAESAATDTFAARKFAQALGGEIVAPGGAIRWRVVEGQVQRSGTPGQDWQPVALPAAATITAGDAPSESVLWLVGKAGAIFVTTDAARFEQVPFPSPADLVSVVAVDDQRAIVTTADGRRFSTTNRGQSWTAP